MTTFQTPTVTIGAGTYYSVIEYVTTINPGNVTVQHRAYVNEANAGLAGYRCRALYNGNSVKEATGYRNSTGGGNTNFAVTDWNTAVIPRAASAQTVTVGVRVTGETVDGWNGGPYSVNQSINISVPAISIPVAPTNVVNARNNDNKNTISWSNPSWSEPTGQPTKNIYRSIDGGDFSIIGTAQGGTSPATSYVDTTTQSNHSYRYAVTSVWYGQESAQALSGYTYNTPNAPGKPLAARSSATNIIATFDNTGNGTGIEWQRSTNGTSWGASTAVSGSGITSFTDSPGAGAFYYRVRNVNGSLFSDWSPTSNQIATITPPAAPTLIAPAQGSIVKKSDAAIVFRWQHNPIDGSAQTDAHLRYSTNGGSTWTIVENIGTAQTYSLSNSFAVGVTVTWDVRTKGAASSFGDRSGVSTFTVKQVPQVSITSPTTANITATPITVAWSYSDQSGTQLSARVSVKDSVGKTVFQKTAQGTSQSLVIAQSDFLPTNGKTYTFEGLVTSTSTLTATASVNSPVQYTPPAVPSLQVEIDPASLTASLLVFAGTGTPATVSLSLFRENADGTLTLVVSGLSSGGNTIDYFPPLDTDITYIAVAYAASGASAQYAVPVNIVSNGMSVIHFGDAFLNSCNLMLDPDYCSSQVSHDALIFQTAGESYPLSFYGVGISRSGSVSGTVPRIAGIAPDFISLLSDLYALAKWTGDVVIRRPFEDSFRATISCSFSKVDPWDFVRTQISWQEVRGGLG